MYDDPVRARDHPAGKGEGPQYNYAAMPALLYKNRRNLCTMILRACQATNSCSTDPREKTGQSMTNTINLVELYMATPFAEMTRTR